MEQYLHILGYVAQALTAVAGILYALRTFTGAVTPNVISWTIWSAVGSVIWYITDHDPKASESAKDFALVLMVSPIAVTLIALFKGTFERPSHWEYGSVVVATVALYWQYRTYDDPGMVPILLAILADACALVPTILFVRAHPDEDRPGAWGSFVIGSFLTFVGALVEKGWSVEALLLPGYMFAGASIVTYYLARYRKSQRAPWREWI